MKTLDEMRRLAETEAAKAGDTITRAKGVRDGELFFYAQPEDAQPGDAIGLPYGYWVDTATGRCRICTGDESIRLLDKEYLAGFRPIPE